MTARLAAILYRWRLPLTGLIILGALILAPRAQITRIDNDLTAWFDRSDPVYRDYERLRHEFTGSRTLIIALEGEHVLSAQGLDGIRRASAEIERLPVVTRVYSLATANRVTAVTAADGEGGIDAQPLVPRAGPIDAAVVRAHALADPLVNGDLLSADGRVTAILVNFDEDRIESVRGDTIDRIRAIATQHAPPGARVHLNGSIEISETYNRVTIANTEKFTPPILLFTCLALYALFRSWRTMLLTLVAVGVSVLWTLGLYSLMGFTFNVLSSMLVPLIVVLAIADDVHIVQHYTEALRETGDRSYAFRATVSTLALPLFAASGTTALGMLSLATSHVHAVRAFGIGSAVGVMVDFVISLVLVPTLLTLIRVDVAPAPQERWLLGPLERVARLSCRRPGLVMIVAGLVAVAAAAGIARLRIDTNHINFFAPRHPLSISANLIDRQLSGVYAFQVFFEGPAESMKEPAMLARMKRLADEMKRLPNVRKVISLVDYVERVNRTLHDDDPQAAVVPTSGALIAQELLLFSLSDGGRQELAHLVTSDFSRAQMTVRLASMSSDVVFEQILEAQRLATGIFEGSGVTATVTGSGRLFAQLDHYLVTSQVSSFATAFVTVFAVIFVVFRSFRFGLLAIVPNVFPVLAVLGLMGWLDISMNVATVMLASVALGVVDDDTIHFISRYRREASAGLDTDGAILAATQHEARAAATTMIVNSCAYAVLIVSEYRPSAWFGGLLALTMAVAFLAEIFILPAAIKLAPRWFSAEQLRRSAIRGAAIASVALLGLTSGVAFAQTSGTVTVMGDHLPHAGDSTELRVRAFVEQKLAPSERVSIVASGWVAGLAASRFGDGRRDLTVQPHDLYVDVTAGAFDLRAGFARVVWGRLDEVQPSDVVNPIDVSTYLFEGRSEARVPVPLARARWSMSEASRLEAIWLPVFRRGRFDWLDEASSPFNLAQDAVGACVGPTCPTITFARDTPPRTLGDSQGGLRFQTTSGRVDWSAAVWRGTEAFGIYEPAFSGPTALPAAIVITERYPRFTMAAGDVESVHGDWAWRGEAAVFFDATIPEENGVGGTPGRRVAAGAGVDRRAGSSHLSATVLVEHRDSETFSDTAVSVVGGLQRDFARDTRQLRAFGAWNATDRSAFLRTSGSWNLRDNVWLEATLGWFAGDGPHFFSRFADRDFVSLRLKTYF